MTRRRLGHTHSPFCTAEPRPAPLPGCLTRLSQARAALENPGIYLVSFRFGEEPTMFFLPVARPQHSLSRSLVLLADFT